MVSIAIKTHFLLLKVNVEYFLSRIIHSACEEHFNQLVQNQGFVALFKDIRKDIEIPEFMAVIAKGNVKEYVLSKLVPPQGLDRFEVILKEGMGISLSGILGEKTWPQIYCAFELRHLIEHRNGKVDARFRKRVIPHWRNSSWRDIPLNIGSAIEIRQDDFERTFESMLKAADAIAGAIRSFTPN
jgi:hypothetical protein